MNISPVSIIVVFIIVVLGFFGYQQVRAPINVTEFDTDIAPEVVDEDKSVAEEIIDSVVDKIPNIGGSTEIYEGISVLNNARVIDLSGKGLTGSLKAEIRHVSSVKVMNLSYNSFTSLPAEIGQLTRLETLNLSNNNLTGLPHELGNLQNLRLLDLSGNNISRSDLDIIRKRLPASTQIQAN